MFVHIYSMLLFAHINALDNSYSYEVVPTNHKLDLRCLTENIEFARAIKYKILSGTCDKLSDDWNKNPSFEAGFVYGRMDWYEPPFHKDMIKTVTFPNNFNVDCGIAVVVETTDMVQDGFIVNIRDSDSSVLYIHLSVRPTENSAVLNTVLNGTWLDEILAPLNGFATAPNTVYTATFVLRSTQWEVYADGVFLNNFTHIHPFNGTGKVKCQSGDMFCKRIIFYAT